MTTIRSSCAMCGDVELAPTDLWLELAAASGTGTYVFRCPHCDQIQHRPANHRVVSILLATGVGYEVDDDGAPITEQEIREFTSALDHGDWQQHLTS